MPDRLRTLRRLGGHYRFMRRRHGRLRALSIAWWIVKPPRTLNTEQH